jgi:putative aminopeptidase FrvX
MAIVIDTVPASDPITPPQQATGECGKGPVIRSMDVSALGWGTIYSKKIRQRLIATALKHGIPHQKDIFRTWTDASTIHTSGKGIPCGGVYIPRRYSHSPIELVKWSDVEKTAELLTFIFMKVELSVYRTGLPEKETFFYVAPLDPAYKTGLSGTSPVKGAIASFLLFFNFNPFMQHFE